MNADLAERLRRRIALTGPISVADFMVEALAHPTMGYYRRAQAVGASGDFVTAPEISQMFGELIGAWLAERWMALGRPDPVRLVELGPGRGTLLADALRATRGVAGFHAGLRLHLVEINPTLAKLQRQALAATALPAQWHERFADVPDDAPILLVANEFFDALPVRQLVRMPAGWCERMIGLASETADVPDPGFTFATAPGASPLATLLDPAVRQQAPLGAIAETMPAALLLMNAIATRIAAGGGAGLVIDYGYDAGSHGDTLQAVRRHTRVGVFEHIGDSDLTAHVDFAALARTAREAGAAIDGPTSQGSFLRQLGIDTRARALLARASPAQARDIETAQARLIAPERMGTLFCVLGVRPAAISPAPGFAPAQTANDSGPAP